MIKCATLFTFCNDRQMSGAGHDLPTFGAPARRNKPCVSKPSTQYVSGLYAVFMISSQDFASSFFKVFILSIKLDTFCSNRMSKCSPDDCHFEKWAVLKNRKWLFCVTIRIRKAECIKLQSALVVFISQESSDGVEWSDTKKANKPWTKNYIKGISKNPFFKRGF